MTLIAPAVQTYAQGFWGLNASDGPDAYAPCGALGGPEDGTVSPTGAISSVTFEPTPALSLARLLYERLAHPPRRYWY